MTDPSIELDVSARPDRPASGPGRRRLVLRWLLAGLGLGAAARAGAAPAQAANGDPVLAGQTVSATSPTTIQGPVSANPTLRATNGFAGQPDALADGIQGFAAGANVAGVIGRNDDLDGLGLSGNAANGHGVFGETASGNGVVGKATSGTGVRGQSGSGNGVYGRTETGAAGIYGSSDTRVGVFGKSTSTYGVHGTSQSAAGVYGSSDTNNGVYGYSPGHKGTSGNSNSGYGVYATSASGTALYARSTSGTTAHFDGSVVVNGDFSVTGAKSAAVPHPDGSQRRLYCLESPESWFEDFGAARLSHGRAQVDLDDDFAALVHTADYAVFLTPEGDCQGLYVASKSGRRFEVRELRGGSSDVAFSYRVVARRQDVAGPRLERVELPKPRGPEAMVDPGIDPHDLPGLPSSPPPTATPTPAPSTSQPTTFGQPALPPLASPTPTASPTATPSPPPRQATATPTPSPTPTRPARSAEAAATPTRTPSPSPTPTSRPRGN